MPTPDPESMLDRALEPYEPPRTPALFGRVAEASIDLDFALLEKRPGETLLEVIAEALASSYGSTTFATAGALIAELERRGYVLRRRESMIHYGGPVVTFGGGAGSGGGRDLRLAAEAFELGRAEERRRIR